MISENSRITNHAAARSAARVNLLTAMNALANLHLEDARKALQAESNQLQATRDHAQAVTAQWEATTVQLLAERDHARQINDQLQSSTQQLLAERDRAHLIYDQLQSSTQQLLAARHELGMVHDALNPTREELRVKEAELKDLQGQVRAMLTSRSWRITAPLRKITSWLQRGEA